MKLGIYGWLLSFSVASLLYILPPSNRPIQFSGDAPSCLTLQTTEGYQYILTSFIAYNVPEKDLDGQLRGVSSMPDLSERVWGCVARTV